MTHEIKSVRPRHAEIIRLAFLGLKHNVIAERVGISAPAVSCVLRSAIAKAELARLQHEAERRLIDTPLRVRAAIELDNAAMESLKFNRSLVNDATVDKKLRSKVASHFLDRLVFNKDPDAEEGSYREILRSLRTIEDQFSRKPVIIESEASAAPTPSQPDGSFNDANGDVDDVGVVEGVDYEVIKQRKSA